MSGVRGGLAAEEQLHPQADDELAVLFGVLSGHHVRRHLLDLVFVLGDDVVHVVKGHLAEAHDHVAHAVGVDLVAHVAVDDLREAELGGGAELELEERWRERVAVFLHLAVLEPFGVLGRVVGIWGDLTTKRC